MVFFNIDRLIYFFRLIFIMYYREIVNGLIVKI